MSAILLRATIILLSAFVIVDSVRGQSTAARISGTITDSSGGSVPDAAITARNKVTGWTISATSNAEGQYVLYPLPPGVYGVEAEKSDLTRRRIGGLCKRQCHAQRST